jgi:hypothetical protein
MMKKLIDALVEYLTIKKACECASFNDFDEHYYNRFDANKMQKITSTLAKLPEWKEYCDWNIVQDVKRFYTAQDAERPAIRGAVSRTRYMRNLGVEQTPKPAVKPLPNSRYAGIK